MKAIKILIYWQVLLVPYWSNAQINQSYFGAESAGMGGAVTASYSKSAVFNNISGITKIDNPTLITGLQSKFYGIFNTVGLGLIYPLQNGQFGFSALRFGDKFYNEQQLSAAYAFDLEGISLGFKANLLQINSSGYGSFYTPILDFGVITQLSQKIWLGGSVRNFTQSGIRSIENEEKLTSELAIGISYQPLTKIKLNIDAVKAIEHPFSIRAGFEYALTNNLLIRTGITGLEQNYHFGASFHLKKITVDYALSTHSYLGFSHQLSISLALSNLTRKQQIHEEE